MIVQSVVNIFIKTLDMEALMPENNYYDLPDRHSARLQTYDYRQPGYYYVTICVAQRKCVLSNIVNSEVYLCPAGLILQEEWNKLPERFQHVRLDQYVIMPNHFHGIVIFENPQQGSLEAIDINASRVPARFRQYIDGKQQVQRVAPDTKGNEKLPILGEVIRTLKAASTYHIRKTSNLDFVWEARLYEHVIRTVSDLTRIREYICNNPVSWQEDMLYRVSQ